MRLLSAQSPKLPPPYENRSPRFAKSALPGAKVKVVKSSEFDFVEAISTQATGMRQYSAPSIRTILAIAGPRRDAPVCTRRSGRRAPGGITAVTVLTSCLQRSCAASREEE